MGAAPRVSRVRYCGAWRERAAANRCRDRTASDRALSGPRPWFYIPTSSTFPPVAPRASLSTNPDPSAAHLGPGPARRCFETLARGTTRIHRNLLTPSRPPRRAARRRATAPSSCSQPPPSPTPPIPAAIASLLPGTQPCAQEHADGHLQQTTHAHPSLP
jgi:hypothetical protein